MERPILTGPAPFGPDEIERAFLAAGLSALPAETYAQFSSYLTVLLRWNRQLNLTSLRAPEQIVQRHLIECSFAAQHLPRDIATLLDFGSGAGFPGIPIALCRPGIRVTLAEGHGKKAAFLREAVRVMDAPIDVFEGRVETLPTIRRFDAVAVRAVEKMETAVPLAATHVTRYLVLLCTEQSSDGFRASVPELRWLPSIPIPASNQIVIAIGKR